MRCRLRRPRSDAGAILKEAGLQKDLVASVLGPAEPKHSIALLMKRDADTGVPEVVSVVAYHCPGAQPVAQVRCAPHARSRGPAALGRAREGLALVLSPRFWLSRLAPLR